MSAAGNTATWLNDRGVTHARAAAYTPADQAGAVIAATGRHQRVNWPSVLAMLTNLQADPWAGIENTGPGGVHRSGAELRQTTRGTA